MITPRALIFDLDHTLADATAVWQRAQEQLAAWHQVQCEDVFGGKTS